ncbi:MAG: PilC/PilY family type IV pilus protein [Collimonas sp.]|uniref:pilus assembly protein n=1 Tax=Collimonas sp. TaxID=1963772 RepID=UPI0032672E45
MLRTKLLQLPLGRLIKVAAHCACLGMAAVSGVALADIAQSPLFLPVPPPPNIMYMLDNSGSMVWGSVTGTDATFEYTALSANQSDGLKNMKAYFSSTWNQIYYNPATLYTPGISKADGVTPMAAADVTNTLVDPYLSTTKLDLRVRCNAGSPITLPLYNPASPFTANSNCSTSTTGTIARYAFYYNWIGTENGTQTGAKTSTVAGSGIPDGSAGQDSDTNYKRVDILSGATYPHATGRTDCTSSTTTCSYAEEMQNFANWFSFYRTRILMTKTSLGAAFSGINNRFRVGFATINANSNNFLAVGGFDTAQKIKWYTKLYAIVPSGGTPLIDALNQVGQYYSGNGINGASSAPDPVQLKCQANFTILSTDGYWNGTVPSTIGNQDSVVPTLLAPVKNDPVSGTALTPGSNFPPPFYEGKTAYSNTLADTAMKYWINDIGVRGSNGGTVGKIKATPTDPATWQHMTTHTIGLGASGKLKYVADYQTATTGDFANIKAGTTAWPKPVADTSTAIDDLWHAAVNGHGRYFSAKNPQLLRAGLNSILAEIGRSTGSGGGQANNVGGAQSNAYFYSTSFDAGIWAGHLKANTLNSDGSTGALQWDAATLLPAWGSRNIVTWNPTSKAAVDFAWTNLTSGTTSQQASLGTSDVVDYLRGNAAMEQASDGTGSGIFRYRQNKLGDIVNSSLLYVQTNDFGYSVLPVANGGGATYTTFVNTTKPARSAMLYVGANDGMLHGFDASTGSEKFAFIPNSVYPNLKTLSDPNYGHTYFVDGPLGEGDAYIGSTWKNILLGTTGAGGNSVFALDVTTPSSLNKSSVLWEYNNDNSDADMGNVLGAPAVVLLANGEWVAIFGNGYNSVNGHAVLYMVDMKTGLVIKKIDTGVGSSTLPNGLSAPALLYNAGRQVIGAYAGDLQGNLWKFDLSNATDTSKWSSSSLFVAKNASSVIQPIVQRPVIAAHPLGGYMVMIGTGKYYETKDLANTDTQSVYGIWDKPGAAAVTGRSQLQQQVLTSVSVGGVVIGRTLTSNALTWASQRGWYIDYLDAGERTVGDMVIMKNILLLSTSLTPNTVDPCAGGGSSLSMGVNFLTGAYAPQYQIFQPGTPTDVNLSAGVIPGTAGGGVPIPTSPPKLCIQTIGADGLPHCLQTQLIGVAVRRWRQLSLKPN